MHAHPPHEPIVAAIDDCEGVGREIVAKDVFGSLGKFVPFLAGAVASAAADAQRAVEEEGLLRYRLSVHFFTYGTHRAVEKLSNSYSSTTPNVESLNYSFLGEIS